MRRIPAIISAIFTEITLAYAENINHNLRITSGNYKMYLWEKPDWPTFTWDEGSLALPFTHKPIDKNSIHPEAEILRT